MNEVISNAFVNFSNHTSRNWTQSQMNSAVQLSGGTVVDVAFPQVSATATEEEIKDLANYCFEEIVKYNPKVVMCQGEFGLTFQLVSLLKQHGIRAVYSCSERKVVEQQTENGTIKTAEFCFVKFRKY